jgi:hypothetical protein
MKDTAYIFKMAYKNKTKVIKWLKDRQNELLRIYFQNGVQKQNEGNKVIKRQAKRTLACSLDWPSNLRLQVAFQAMVSGIFISLVRGYVVVMAVKSEQLKRFMPRHICWRCWIYNILNTMKSLLVILVQAKRKHANSESSENKEVPDRNICISPVISTRNTMTFWNVVNICQQWSLS